MNTVPKVGATVVIQSVSNYTASVSDVAKPVSTATVSAAKITNSAKFAEKKSKF